MKFFINYFGKPAGGRRIYIYNINSNIHKQKDANIDLI